MAGIQDTLSKEEIGQVPCRDLLEPRLFKILSLGVVLAVFQQWCGINVIFNYPREVFQAAGYQVGEVLSNIVITGLVNLVFTLWRSRPSTAGEDVRSCCPGQGASPPCTTLGLGYWLGSQGPRRCWRWWSGRSRSTPCHLLR